MGYQGTLGGLLRLHRFPRGWLSVLVVLSVFLLWRGYRGSGEHRIYKNPHDFKYLANPGPSVCGRAGPVALLVLVTSGLQHAERRRAIRQTWGSSQEQRRHGMRLVFLLGTSDRAQPGLETSLTAEADHHGDIVREDFLDSYQNLTLKTLAGIKWASDYCGTARFVLKTDDDMYVNVGGLTEYLTADFSDSQKVITGCVKNDPAGPHQPLPAGGPAGGPGLPFTSVHPLFMAGAGYVLSGDLLRPLYKASLNIRLVKVEDAFLTGYCARRVGGVRKVHQEKFSCGQLVVRDCELSKTFTGHKITPARMVEIHNKLTSGSCQSQ